ncbi:MAG: SDR family oxidoreductase [Chitinophagia bacterium]|nr:SDR family oxidoreductase [Chitinophagia bacterium]
MEKALIGKTCLVTGASRGIGKSISEIFAYHGADLILLAKNEGLLQTLIGELLIKHPQGIFNHFVCDVGDPESVKSTFKQIRSKNLNINVVVNNAGIMSDAVLPMARAQIIEDVLRVNLMGCIFISQQAAKFLIKNRGGSIINLSSIIGTNGGAGQTVYGSAKAGIIGFTKSLAKELAAYQIRVNAIAPGFIETDMTKGKDLGYYEKNLANIGMKRFGVAEDVAKVALFLASEMSGYVTGQIIGVDGGMLI